MWVEGLWDIWDSILGASLELVGNYLYVYVVTLVITLVTTSQNPLSKGSKGRGSIL